MWSRFPTSPTVLIRQSFTGETVTLSPPSFTVVFENEEFPQFEGDDAITLIVDVHQDPERYTARPLEGHAMAIQGTRFFEGTLEIMIESPPELLENSPRWKEFLVTSQDLRQVCCDPMIALTQKHMMSGVDAFDQHVAVSSVDAFTQRVAVPSVGALTQRMVSNVDVFTQRVVSSVDVFTQHMVSLTSVEAFAQQMASSIDESVQRELEALNLDKVLSSEQIGDIVRAKAFRALTPDQQRQLRSSVPELI